MNMILIACLSAWWFHTFSIRAIKFIITQAFSSTIKLFLNATAQTYFQFAARKKANETFALKGNFPYWAVSPWTSLCIVNKFLKRTTIWIVLRIKALSLVDRHSIEVVWNSWILDKKSITCSTNSWNDYHRHDNWNLL